MALYEASPKGLKARGLTARDARRLFNALCTLVDYEGKLKDALVAKGRSPEVLHDQCDALRYLVDGEEG